MRKAIIGATAAIALLGAAAAYAFVGRGDTWAIKGAVTPNAGGTKAQPVAVGATFTSTETAPDGLRPSTPSGLDWKWTGVYENGGDFPKCSVAAVAEHKSNSVCPKGSLVATMRIVAKIGPEGNTSPGDTLADSAGCLKSIDIYNSGAGKAFWWAYGPGSACAGVAYLPPLPMTWKRTSTGSEAFFVLPENIGHPLPGVEGAFTTLSNVKFPRLTAKVHGKTVGYLESICKKGTKRTFSFTWGDPAPEGTRTTTTTIGKCG